MRIESADRMLDVGLEGRSQQGDRSGEFKITGQVTDLISPDGTLNLQAAKGNLEADVKDLPIDSVDGLLGCRVCSVLPLERVLTSIYRCPAQPRCRTY